MGEQTARMQMFLFFGTMLQQFSFVLPESDPAWDIDPINTGGHFRKPPPFQPLIMPRV